MGKSTRWVILACAVCAALLVVALLMRSHVLAAPAFITGGSPAPTSTAASIHCPGAPTTPQPNVKEFCARNQDGHAFEHRVQVYQGTNQIKNYYGQQDANGAWQWQQQTWFPGGAGVPNGIVATYEYASRAANGAWQHQYDWRVSPTGAWNDCYAQSNVDEHGQARAALFVCHLASGDTSGSASPVPLANPQFQERPHW